MKKLLLGLLLLVNLSVYATEKTKTTSSENITFPNIICIGMDGAGKTVHVIIDGDVTRLHVNGDILKIDSLTENKKGFATENFITQQGIYTYYSFFLKEDKTITLIQFNASTSKIIARANLSCHKE